jgi:hypothetical protein
MMTAPRSLLPMPFFAVPFLAAPFLAAALAAAAAPAQNSKRTPDAPLDFDPARPERIDGWWTNGKELLTLEGNGAYRLWVSQDRFKRPVEVGAWRRTNYVFFDLEPYRAKPGTRFRVNLQKDGGVTELVREGMGDFRSVPSPPRVMADEMLGAWISPQEQLLVLDNGRYEWRRTGPAQGITEHSGNWNSEGDVLTLAPDTTAVELTSLRCTKGADGQWTLESRGGRMTRPPLSPPPGGPDAEAPPPAPKAPAPPAPAPASGAPAPATPSADG